jgi:uncharacterized protein
MKKSVYIIFLFVLLFSFSTYAKAGSMKLLAVSGEKTNQKGSTADLYLEVKEGTGRVFIDSFPLSKIDTQISTRFAKEVACNFLEIDCSKYDFFYTIRANSAIVGGPSAGAAIAVLTVSVLDDLTLNDKATITGTINTGGIIGPVGGVLPKITAGAEAGLKKLLVPKYSRINESNLSEYESIYGVEVIEVSQLQEAIKEMTGKEYKTNDKVNISTSYIGTMQSISIELCERAETLVNETKQENTTATEQLRKGKNALDTKQFYSAASFCFGSGLNSQYLKLRQDNLNQTQIKSKINEIYDRITEYKNLTDKKEIQTITDLETYMVVNDRILEARERANDALFYLAKNDTNASLYNLAYGIERLNSARSWSVFFGKPGQGYKINKKVLEESCLKKISEVEERIQYLDLYLPSDTLELKKTVSKSYEDYNNGNPELCLYEASISKAKVDSVLNTIAIDSSDISKVIEDRAQIVRSGLAKQTEKGAFPILGYSYYEYANSLKEGDSYSALLYLEYALELGNLDIYFEKRTIDFPTINKREVVIFSVGLVLGVVCSVLLTRKKKKRQ